MLNTFTRIVVSSARAMRRPMQTQTVYSDRKKQVQTNIHGLHMASFELTSRHTHTHTHTHIYLPISN